MSTTIYQRTTSVLSTQNFLRALIDPKQTPHVPAAVRHSATLLLKHYPHLHEMEKTARACPELWGFR